MRNIYALEKEILDLIFETVKKSKTPLAGRWVTIGGRRLFIKKGEKLDFNKDNKNKTASLPEIIDTLKKYSGISFSKKEIGKLKQIVELSKEDYFKLKKKMVSPHAVYNDKKHIIIINKDSLKNKSMMKELIPHEIAHTRNAFMDVPSLIKEIDKMNNIAKILKFNAVSELINRKYKTTKNDLISLRERHAMVFAAMKIKGKSIFK